MAETNQDTITNNAKIVHAMAEKINLIDTTDLMTNLAKMTKNATAIVKKMKKKDVQKNVVAVAFSKFSIAKTKAV